MRSGRNNVLAGSLFLFSVIAAVAVVILLAGGLEQIGKREYTVRFSLTDGVTGLEPGSKIYVGGQPVGVVSELVFGRSSEGEIMDTIVTIRVDPGIRLRTGAVAQLNTPLLGGSASINFPYIGEGAELTPSERIEGHIAPPGLLAQAGYGPDQAEQLKRIMQRADDITARIDKATIEAQVMVEDAKAVIADVRARSGPWLDRVDSITKNVDDTMAHGPALAQSAEDRLAQLRDVIDENRENVKATLANANSVSGKADIFMDRLKNELTDLAAGFLLDGREALASGQDMLDRAKGLLVEQEPNIRRSMANFRLASDELTGMMNEVRRSPWRLLYRPDRREMDFELLYDSARAYAGAVSDLRAAGEAVRAVVDAGDAKLPAGAATLGSLLSDLDGSFEKYKGTEQEFLRQIMRNAEKAP